MEEFLYKQSFSEKDILELIENEIEESIHLDFKAAGALGKSEGKRKEISKDVSAFANSDGGVIIYGVNEKNHKADSLSFIDGNIFTKEWLEQIISSAIQKRISDLKIIPLRFDNKIEKTIYIVHIPKSMNTPHLCKDKRFYKRYNFESVQMEEYEIRELYGRKSKSKLQILSFNISEKKENGKVLVLFSFDVFNKGDVPEASYKLNVYFNNFNKLITLTWDKINTNYDYTVYQKKRIKISAENRLTIYPTEKITVMRFTMEIDENNIKQAIEKLNMEMILFYSNGKDTFESPLDDLRKLFKI